MEVELGVTTGLGGNKPAMMDVDELLATRLLIQGNSGSGKSHLLRRLLEQSAEAVQQVIIDPEGDFVSLADRYGHVVVNADRSEKDLQTIAGRVRENRISCVLNLESLDSEQQMKAAAIFLNALFDAEREFWYPVLVAVDEAQLFAPSGASEGAEDIRRMSLGAMTNLMCRGRKRGLAGIIATQRLAKLAKNVAAEASNFLMGRTFLDIDMVRAADLLGMEKRQAEQFRELGRGHFIALGPALSRKPLPIQVGSVETQARGSTPKLSARPEVSAEEAREIVLAAIPPTLRQVERRPVEPVAPTESVLEEISERRHEADGVAAPAGVGAEDRRRLYRAIVADIMSDPEQFFAPEPVLFQEFQTRVRIKRLGGNLPDMAEFRRHMVPARAGVSPEMMESEAFAPALELSRQIAEDLRGVYLLLAKAAVEGAPCPTDATIARVCGSRSPGRAFSRVKSLENYGYIVIRNDLKGNRVVSVPDLGVETAASDPKGPDLFEPPAPEAAGETEEA